MSFADLIRLMFRRAANAQRPPPMPFKNHHRAKLQMEALEDRTVPTAIVTIAAGGDATEGGFPGSGSFIFTRTGDTSSSLMVLYTASGSATPMSDYGNTGGVSFGSGSSSATYNVIPTNDSNVEGTETVTFSVAGGTGYTVGSPSSATINIYDNDTPRVTVAQQGSNPTEGGNGAFRITRTGSTASSLAVAYSVGGTATSGTDYTSIGASATIAAGHSYVDVTVATTDDYA